MVLRYALSAALFALSPGHAVAHSPADGRDCASRPSADGGETWAVGWEGVYIPTTD